MALVLDEACVTSCGAVFRGVFTLSLQIAYQAAAPLLETLQVEAHVERTEESSSGTKIHTVAELSQLDGTVLATASALCFQPADMRDFGDSEALPPPATLVERRRETMRPFQTPSDCWAIHPAAGQLWRQWRQADPLIRRLDAHDDLALVPDVCQGDGVRGDGYEVP